MENGNTSEYPHILKLKHKILIKWEGKGLWIVWGKRLLSKFLPLSPLSLIPLLFHCPFFARLFLGLICDFLLPWVSKFTRFAIVFWNFGYFSIGYCFWLLRTSCYLLAFLFVVRAKSCCLFATSIFLIVWALAMLRLWYLLSWIARRILSA